MLTTIATMVFLALIGIPLTIKAQRDWSDEIYEIYLEIRYFWSVLALEVACTIFVAWVLVSALLCVFLGKWHIP